MGRILVEALSLPEVKLVRGTRFDDDRGWLSETWSARDFAAAGIGSQFVQDNQSRSTTPGTIRGLHYQSPPHALAKLVRVLRGAILDVVVDIRHGSPTFGRHVAVTLAAHEPVQLLVPEGFAHGFCSLEPETEVFYKMTGFYAPDHDHGLRWNDPALGIAWPVDPDKAVLSPKDRGQPLLADLPQHFVFGG